MGHVKPKRKVCYQTADGRIHQSKKEAELHVARLAKDLKEAKEGLKSLVKKQKEEKKKLAATIEATRQRELNGYGTPWIPYACWNQREIARTASFIRYAERNIAAYKRQLKGEKPI